MANRNPGRKRRLTPLGKLAVVFVCALLLLGGCFAVRGVLQSLYPQRYDDFVETYTAEHGLEKSFVYAVIKCESGFDPQAVSPVGARGLMQIMPETFEWLQSKTGEKNDLDALFDPETSVRYGCMLYEILLRQFPSPHTAICAYHAGMGNVEKWLRDPQYSDDGKTLKNIPFPATAHYADKVLRVQKIYETLYK